MSGVGFITSGVPLASLAGGFMSSSLAGKVIVLVQVSAAVFAAAVIAGRNQELNSILRDSKRFLREFLSGRDVLDYYLLGEKGRLRALELIYNRTCERMVKVLDPELRRAVIGRQGGTENAALSPREIELVREACAHAVQEEKLRVERGLVWLAASVAASLMLGFLGTAWGVLDAFAGLAAAGGVSLSGVVSALSSSLVTTVVGLLIAIPGAIFYYHLAMRVRQLAADMDGFAGELMGRIACEFQGGND